MNEPKGVSIGLGQKLFSNIFNAINRLLVFLFFDQVKIEGLHNIPKNAPFIIIANHCNGFIDAFLIKALLKQRIIFAAKSTLKNNPILNVFFGIFGAIPLYRASEISSKERLTGNQQSFEIIVQHLIKGTGLIIFPEGKSHSATTMLPFKTGFARIAHLYKATYHQELPVIPLAFHYVSKENFRSSVLIEVGEALPWQEDINEFAKSGEKVLNEMLVPVEQEREMAWLKFVNDLLLTQGAEPLPLEYGAHSVTQQQINFKNLRHTYLKYKSEKSNLISDVFEKVKTFRKKLRTYGVSTSDLFIDMNPAKVIFFILRELEIILIGTPIALIGLILWGLPWLLIRFTAIKLTKEKDQWLTNAYTPALLLIPLWLIFLMLLSAYFWGLAGLILMGIGALYCGVGLVLFHDRIFAIGKRSTTFLKWLFMSRVRENLADDAKKLIYEIQKLLEA